MKKIIEIKEESKKGQGTYCYHTLSLFFLIITVFYISNSQTVMAQNISANYLTRIETSSITNNPTSTINSSANPLANKPLTPTSTASAALSLSLDKAIELAIKNNLTTQVAQEKKAEAYGRAMDALAALLPTLTATASQSTITENPLALTGNFIPGSKSTLVGPFDSFDSRLHFSQSIFNLSSIRRVQAEKVDRDIAAYQEQFAREQVATVTALAYTNYQRANLAVEAAQNNVELAKTLFKLAEDQKKAGIATGVDTARADTRLAQEQVKLLQAQTAAITARLQLQRIVGLPLESTLILTDSLRFTSDPFPSVDAALSIALDNRVELKIAQGEVKFADFNKKAAQAQQLPSIDFVADYGLSGSRPDEIALPTRSAGIRLSLPIFNGRIKSQVAIAKSQKRQKELQLNDLHTQVSEDVMLAIQTLDTNAAEVKATEKAVELAQKELKMAKDRFMAGVGDNIEVVNAQTSLSNIQDLEIAALAKFNNSRINLAAALGQAQTFRW